METPSIKPTEKQGKTLCPRRSINVLSEEDRKQLIRLCEQIHNSARQWVAVNRDAPDGYECFCDDTVRRLRASGPLAPLLAQRQWVIWKWERRGDKLTKVPYQANNPSRNAKSNDPRTWATFDMAVASAHYASGIGFVLSEGEICAFDLDKCRDPATGALAVWARKLLEECGSYAEITPSGTGLRIIGYGSGEKVHQKVKKTEKLDGLSEAGSLEIYRKPERYITVSGVVLDGYDLPLANIDAAIDRYRRADKAQGAAERSAEAPAAASGNGASRPAPASVIEAIRSEAHDGKRSDRLFEAVRELKRLAWSPEEIENLFLENPGAILAKYGKRLRTEIDRAYEKIETDVPGRDFIGEVTLEDFVAYMPSHSYIYIPTFEFWAAASVNARIPPVVIGQNDDGEPIRISASAWLDRNNPVEQTTWAPGYPMLIRDRLVSDGGWIERSGVTCFNYYRPPATEPGDARQAAPWLKHVRRVFGCDARHIVRYFACKVQHPFTKINHALDLGGEQGIGKDTLLEPVKYAVGPWNFAEVSPAEVLEKFNAHGKSVILRISEARDLGDVDRFKFYDHMKTLCAAPPDVLRINEKHLRQYYAFNCCGIVITTNYKTDALFLPADDRRNFVAWTDRKKEDFKDNYWNDLWGWYARGGLRHAAAYLRKLDVSGFDPKAPPPKTRAFWAIVDANRAPEEDELSNILEKLGNPEATLVAWICDKASDDNGFKTWLKDRKNQRSIPHKLERCGYVRVRNDSKQDGRWKIKGEWETVYAKRSLSLRDQIIAARDLKERIERGAQSPF
jgi:hypothetical protein